MARLVFTDPRFQGTTYECVQERTAVGRAGDNHLVIPHASVSEHHCVVLVHGTEVILRDLGSTNGTFVNGLRLVNQQAAVRHGATVQFGDVEARVEIPPGEGHSGDTEITAVYGHGRAIRAMRSAGANPAPPNPAVELIPRSPEDGAQP
ncbi:MAG: hypothetical protein RJA22_1170 [Verrucomicrobiota bacterium]